MIRAGSEPLNIRQLESRHGASQSLAAEPRRPHGTQAAHRTLLTQWQEATRALCVAAYAPYKDGTIDPQLVVGCDDHLNRALLKEFTPLNNHGDLERTP